MEPECPGTIPPPRRMPTIYLPKRDRGEPTGQRSFPRLPRTNGSKLASLDSSFGFFGRQFRHRRFLFQICRLERDTIGFMSGAYVVGHVYSLNWIKGYIR